MNYSINHVWIQAVRIPKSNVETCPIPDGLIANAREIARTHDGVPVNIWVDICGVGQTDADIITKLNEQETAPNITFKSLDEVPKYIEDPFFRLPPQTQSNLFWDQADIARVRVIEHLLEKNEAAIYSDMDMNLFDRHFSRALRILKEHSAVVGLDGGKGGLENQFFGFKPEKQAFVSNVLLRKDDNFFEYYDIFLRSFDPKHAQPYGIDRKQIETPMYEISDARRIKRSYQKLGIHFTQD